MNRRLAREKAFQILFSIDNESFDVNEAFELSMEDEESSDFLENLIYGVTREKESIDERIENSLEKWTLKRVGAVEKTLIRIAAYEIFSELKTPEGVAINEAIELAHVYGDEKSGQFINGVLSKMIK
ncbi:NusB antitermination factor [Pelagirhabdus alkalitolerans]|uniref:Transcription antitermination protein NusB n=1 Tax=Pelagirhabdus alkalitolerans TaxID=1612202 RepID=A0A1G6I1X0_9BACI|nr:transcription antitermination factor NusB [Pelagirhabdus alkalitolerans]SDC00373.1 NusB antitermination factor [Pelagirhabdus alkalitolerans]